MEEIRLSFKDMDVFETFIYAGDMGLLYALILLMILDIITGIAKAIKNKDLWTRKSLFGYSRKIMIFCIIILANTIDQILNLNSGLLMVTIFFYIANEGLSIIENCAEMDVLIPDEISERLALIKNKNGKGDNTNGSD